MTAGSGPQGIRIRPLHPDWSSRLGRFFEALAAAGDELWFHPFPLDRVSAVQLALLDGADRYLIATRGRELLAFGMLRGWDEGYDVPSLGIAVHPRARRTGLGHAMMSALHAEARRAGARRIRLRADPHNHGAIRLYETFGYQFEDGDGDGDEVIGYAELSDG